MITKCIDNNSEFGIILKSKTKNQGIGCTATIIDILFEHESGEYDIVVKGNKRFSLLKTNKKDNLMIGDVLTYSDENSKPKAALISQVQDKYLNILLNHKITRDLDIEMNRSKSYDFTQKIILPNKLKQIFLETPSESGRLQFLNNLFNQVILTKNQKIDNFTINNK